MKNFFDLPLNSAQATLMHIDINSCFATIEQQANPFLRGKPVAVVAHDYPRGCILAASIEAKRYGIKTGTILADAKKIYPKIITIEPDPDKYRYVHKKFRTILEDYTYELFPKSIDEFVIELSKGAAIKKSTPFEIAQEIKKRIREEIGEWISVSIGIGTNRFWAKMAAGYKKPDGLTLIDKSTLREVFSDLKLIDIHGINTRNELRLNKVGIYTPIQFLDAKQETLRAAFQSISANYWYYRLRGWEIDSIEFSRKSFGNTYSMPGGPSSIKDLSPILMKLVFKSSMRLRKKGFFTQGVHLGIRYKNHPYWHKGKTLDKPIFDTRDIYSNVYQLLKLSPRKPVSNLAVTCFNLTDSTNKQLDIFQNIEKKRKLIHAMDKVNEKWSTYTLFPARMLTQVNKIPEAIGFGNIKEIN